MPKSPLAIKAQEAVTAVEHAFKDKKLRFFEASLMGMKESHRESELNIPSQGGYISALEAIFPKHDWEWHQVGGDEFYKAIQTDNIDVLADLDGLVYNCCYQSSVNTAKKFFQNQLTQIKVFYNLN